VKRPKTEDRRPKTEDEKKDKERRLRLRQKTETKK
jgi:hypothetical protein